MKISTLFYTLKQGICSIFRNKWFSLASVATISACLFLFGLFYAIVSNFQHIVQNAEKVVSVTVFFKEGTEDARIQQIGDLIWARTEEVSDVVYTSADEAWVEFSEKTNFGEYAEGFPDNPLQNSANYKVFLKDVSKQDRLVDYLWSLPEVRRVNASSVAAVLSGFNLLIAYVSTGIIAILLAVSVFLISNTVTIGISIRQEEINIMKYIGATDFFVRAPFVIEGMLIGLIGAGIPLGLIYLLYNKVIVYTMSKFPALSSFLDFLTVDMIFNTLVPLSLCVGVGIGFLGSVTTVRKHLRV